MKTAVVFYHDVQSGDDELRHRDQHLLICSRVAERGIGTSEVAEVPFDIVAGLPRATGERHHFFQHIVAKPPVPQAGHTISQQRLEDRPKPLSIFKAETLGIQGILPLPQK